MMMLGLVNLLPFLAPIFMRLNWTAPANLIYTVYSPLCHQLAQRSFFLFGPQPMYNINELPVNLLGDQLTNISTLRAFIGNPHFGWKVAWSDRMVYMFGAMWLTSIPFGFLKHYQTIKPLSLPSLFLLLLPLMLDGGTHLLSDMTGGLLVGFRYNNQWLAYLTAYALPNWFYIGDSFGSFNSWGRIISGFLFGIALIWFSFPYLDGTFSQTAAELRDRLS
jgi:uncharacterized membrane protein